MTADPDFPGSAIIGDDVVKLEGLAVAINLRGIGPAPNEIEILVP